MFGKECNKNVQIKNIQIYKTKDNSYIVTFNTNVNNMRQEIRGRTREETLSKLALRVRRVLHVH